MINDKQLMEELAVLEVQQETSSELVSENYKSSNTHCLDLEGFLLYRKTQLNDSRISEIVNFMEATLCEEILTQEEVIKLADFYHIDVNLNEDIRDQESDIYEGLQTMVDDYYKDSCDPTEYEEENSDFESFSDNYDEEYAKLEAKLHQEKATPGNNIDVSKASNGRDSIEMMVLGLI